MNSDKPVDTKKHIRIEVGLKNQVLDFIILTNNFLMNTSVKGDSILISANLMNVAHQLLEELRNDENK